MEEIKKIVVQMPNWLGDAVMALPALQRIKEICPHSHVTVLTHPSCQDLYACVSGVDHVVSLTRGIPLSDVFALRTHVFDLGILLTNSFSSALRLRLLACADRVGYRKEGRQFLLTRSFSLKESRGQVHQALFFYRLVEQALKAPAQDMKEPRLKVKTELKAKWKKWLNQTLKGEMRPVVAMGIGAAFGPAKDWSQERYRQLGERLYRKHNAAILLLGTAKDEAKANFISRGEKHIFYDMTGKTSLIDGLALLSLSQAFVGNDSGLAHCAAALGCPSSVIFGSTQPAFTRPLNAQTRVIYKALSCSPCFKRSCPLKTLQCMKEIKVDDVLETVAI